jgi:hypothetical protein
MISRIVLEHQALMLDTLSWQHHQEKPHSGMDIN